jgi:hypothetical protein
VTRVNAFLRAGIAMRAYVKFLPTAIMSDIYGACADFE